MTKDYNQLFEQIKAKKSFLCVGLDSDIAKIPAHLLGEDDPVFAFNRAIIDATEYLHTNYPEIFTIADAKRGDIGNTSRMYAKAFLETIDFDSITVAPYMGEDSVTPFLEYPGKWVILLALTSNKGAFDFQFFEEEGEKLYERVLRKSQEWGDASRMMYVVGATKADMLEGIRRIVPDHFLLVPGVGAQGGSLEEVAKYGMNARCSLLVNSSRGIIFADRTENFAVRAGEEARKLQRDMERLLAEHGIC